MNLLQTLLAGDQWLFKLINGNMSNAFVFITSLYPCLFSLGIDELQRSIRAQGNATEYIPAAIAGLAVLAVAGAAPIVVHIAGAVMFIGRVVHAVGLSLSLEASLARSWGMTITWIGYIIIGVALLVFSVV